MQSRAGLRPPLKRRVRISRAQQPRTWIFNFGINASVGPGNVRRVSARTFSLKRRTEVFCGNAYNAPALVVLILLGGSRIGVRVLSGFSCTSSCSRIRLAAVIRIPRQLIPSAAHLPIKGRQENVARQR
jgi:hypothetical protein